MPHDALFKSFLTPPDTARDFMEIHLPKDLRELCDLDTLKLESTSFVDEKLRALHSDILWSVKTREGDGYIYVVIEHQSREDIHMAFWLMRYSMAVIQRHIEHDKRQPRWSSRCCFITVAAVLILVPVLAGRIYRPDYRTEALYRRVPAGGYHCRAGRRDCAASQSRPAGVAPKAYSPAQSDGAYQ